MVKTKQNEQQARRIAADTTVLQANFKRNVTVTMSGADSMFSRTKQIAEATANQRMLEAEAAAIEEVQRRLGLNAEQVVIYQQFASYHMMTNASFIYGLGNTMLTLPARQEGRRLL